MLLLSAVAALAPARGAGSDLTAIVGGTIVDVSAFGHGTHDIPDAVVLLREGLITAAGPRSAVAVPAGAATIDAGGGYIIPGLVDGFAGLNSQGQASAYLYMGVTTVVGSGDDRRGRLDFAASPSPHLYVMDGVGSKDEYDLVEASPPWRARLKDRPADSELTPEETALMMREQAARGYRALWVGHSLTAENVHRIVLQGHQLGLVTYGEFIAAPYAGPIRDGVDVLLHMSRYELGLAPPELIAPIGAHPYGPEAAKAYAYVEALDPANPRVAAYGRLVAAAHTALMPTFSLAYADLPGHRNLWLDPAAALLDPAGVFHPTGRRTGERDYRTPAERERIERFEAHLWAINRVIAAQHPRYLAATGAAVFASLPGISMHVEMELLVRVGLTPREALAAATGNYAEHLGWRELGAVAPGRRADLLILGADPRTDIRHTAEIRKVILAGKTVDRAALLAAATAPR